MQTNTVQAIIIVTYNLLNEVLKLSINYKYIFKLALNMYINFLKYLKILLNNLLITITFYK